MMLWPFSSPTRNRVSGMTSLTTPSISIVSSFATHSPSTGQKRRCGERGCGALAGRRSDHLEVRGGDLAVGAALKVEREFLVLAQRRQPGPFDRGDVDEHVLGSVVRLDEAETLG